MKAGVEIIIGAILIIFVIWFLVAVDATKGWNFWNSVLSCIKGGVTILVFLIGLALLFFGFSELKE